MSRNSFVPIHAIFYSVFHPTEGSKISCQFPPNSISTSNDPHSTTSIEFDHIKNYIIPKPALCNRLLTFKVGSYRLVSFPVNIPSSHYARNSFNFNFVFVFPYISHTVPYEDAIGRLAKMFKVLEESEQILSKSENDSKYFRGEVCSEGQIISVENLITKIYQDLNNYSECLIPIDGGNSVDIKLFPVLNEPVSPEPEYVPYATVNLNKVIDVNWDPTMLKIVPYINGVNSIAKIAKLSNSDLGLVLECVKVLTYWKCVVFGEIFTFSNIYSCTSGIDGFLSEQVASECQLYVSGATDIYDLPMERVKPPLVKVMSSVTIQTSSTGSNHFDAVDNVENVGNLPSKNLLFKLYCDLDRGQTVREFFLHHYKVLKANKIDIRRFISFGILRGLIYRVEAFPVFRDMDAISTRLLAKHNLKSLSTDSKEALSSADIHLGDEPQHPSAPPLLRMMSTMASINPMLTFEGLMRRGSGSSAGSRPQVKPELELPEFNELALLKCLKNVDNMDRICTTLGLHKEDVDSILQDLSTGSALNMVYK